MTAPPELRVGVVGYGVMGKAHCYGYRIAPMLRTLPVTPVVSVISGRSQPAVAAAAAAYGVPEYTTDWRALVARDDIAIVDICTPPGTHAQIAQAAAAAGKAVLCEKPLALTYPQAAQAAAAVEAAGVHNAVGFNYRRLPAVALLRRMVAEGAVGEVRLWRATWLSDEFADPATPYDWRFDREMGGTTIADLGSHLIDLALWLGVGAGGAGAGGSGQPGAAGGTGQPGAAGGITSVCAQTQTFIRDRPRPGGGTRPVTVDDAASALLRFGSGALGTIEVARAAVRRPCDFTIEVNGSRGTLVFDYARLNELRYGSADDDAGLYGMRRIRAEHPSHPYAASWWPLGQGVGYGSSFGNQVADLLAGWPEAPWSPGFRQGAAVQAVCDAMAASAAQGRWVAVSEITGPQPPPA
jgi:predicted dehydrogenase